MTTEIAPPDRIINYAFLLGGITAAVFGAILLFRQDAAIGVVALLLGLYWLIQGAFLIFSVFIDRTDMWWKLILGVIGLTAGIVVLANPVQSGTFLGTALAAFLGIIGILIGIIAVVGGLRSREFGSVAFGVLSGAIGVLVLVYPEGSFTTLVTILGILLIVQGLAATYIALTAK